MVILGDTKFLNLWKNVNMKEPDVGFGDCWGLEKDRTMRILMFRFRLGFQVRTKIKGIFNYFLIF